MGNFSDDGAPRAARFGAYEADFVTGELRKHGLRIKIQEKPLRVLQALVEHAGELVTREDLRARIWPADVYVDFDRNLKTAVNKLRSALSDSAESHRYIETLPRRGFRFIAPVELTNGNGAGSAAAVVAQGPLSDLAAFPASVEKPWRYKANAALQKHWPWAAVALALLAGGAFYLRVIRRSAPASLQFHQHDWVLVAQFENLSGQPLLDRTVEYAVQRELSNSRFVSIASPERIHDALALMKEPADARLTRSLAQQVCLRDGGIQALITGRVEKLGGAYVLSAAIVDPTTDTQVAGVEAQARDLNGILPAVHRLSDQLRQALGEKLRDIRTGNLKLEKVTTPSLHALQLYSQANAIIASVSRGQDGPAIPLLKQALAEDPNFASAQVLLAYAYSNLGQRKQGIPHFEKALRLSSAVSERERLFIEASYYGSVKEDHNKEVGLYEALLRLYPDDYWSTNNLSYVLRGLGRWDEAAEMTGRRADLRPSNFRANFQAWWDLSRMGRYDEARYYLQRAKALETAQTRKAYPFPTMALTFAGAESDLRNWDSKAALEETKRLAATYPRQTGEARDDLADEVGFLYLSLGKVRLAGKWFRKLPSGDDRRNIDFFELAEVRGDTAGERRALERQFANNEQLGPGTAVRLARLGVFSESQKVIRRLKKLDYYQPGWTWLARGGLAYYQRRPSQALRLLRKAIEELAHDDPPHHAMAANLLATAYEQQGRFQKAIQTLQPLEDRHALDVDASFHLFHLYVKVGDAHSAKQVRAHLLQRLAYADPDYPILVQLRKPLKLRTALAAKP